MNSSAKCHVERERDNRATLSANVECDGNNCRLLLRRYIATTLQWIYCRTMYSRCIFRMLIVTQFIMDLVIVHIYFLHLAFILLSINVVIIFMIPHYVTINIHTAK